MDVCVFDGRAAASSSASAGKWIAQIQADGRERAASAVASTTEGLGRRGRRARPLAAGGARRSDCQRRRPPRGRGARRSAQVHRVPQRWRAHHRRLDRVGPSVKTVASLVDEFEAGLPFKLDVFQREAIDKLERGQGGVLVSAPTSSGKTMVAEYAIFRALQEGAKVLYTTPLKALSNQKYHDFVRQYGESTVGLVTGENTINDEAPVLVMTTEILRNLIYEDPMRLDLVRYVVLDEVHYIDDFPRGSVWEEIVIQAPATIKLVGLSATIGNYQEIADWMAENRGGMETVFHDVRPVELKMWMAINNRFLPLFKGDGGIEQRTWTRAAQEEEASYRVGRYRGLPSNDLLHVVPELRGLDMLPAIYFIFSRRGCREALHRTSHPQADPTT